MACDKTHTHFKCKSDKKKEQLQFKFRHKQLLSNFLYNILCIVHILLSCAFFFLYLFFFLKSHKNICLIDKSPVHSENVFSSNLEYTPLTVSFCKDKSLSEISSIFTYLLPQQALFVVLWCYFKGICWEQMLYCWDALIWILK